MAYRKLTLHGVEVHAGCSRWMHGLTTYTIKEPAIVQQLISILGPQWRQSLTSYTLYNYDKGNRETDVLLNLEIHAYGTLTTPKI